VARYLLEEDISFNFHLIGISSHYHDYRVCWAINKSLSFNLERSESEILIQGRLGEDVLAFPAFYFLCPESEILFELISNRNESGYLIPEMKQADYFLKVDDFYDDSISELIQKLRSISMINMAYSVDPENLRSKYNLIY
jgi:hypothetical protein